MLPAIVLLTFACKGTKGTGKSDKETTKANRLEDTRWELIEIMGKPVAEYGEQIREPHIILNSKESRMSGSGGCNLINGGYELKEGNRIHFGKVVSTMMACPEMQLEGDFLQNIESVDNYVINDAGELVLTKAKMAPMFRFKAVP